MKYLQNIAGIVLVAGISILGGCSELDDNQTGGTGYGSVTVIFNQSTLRTLYPDTTQITAYELSFTGGPETREPESIAVNETKTVNLEVGTWTITVTAYAGTTPTAAGSQVVNITDGGAATANITLTPVFTGNGTFTYSIEFPTSITTATLTISNLDGTVPTNGTITMPGDSIAAGHWTGEQTFAAGYYFMNLQVWKGNLVAGKTEVVHIFAGLTTATPTYSFTNDDLTLSGMPIVNINTTASGAAITATYQNATIRIANTTDPLSDSGVKIKLDADSGLYKKSYNIELDAATALFGEAADKEWVLLANDNDPTLLHTDALFKMGKLSRLGWTPCSHFVNLYINGAYCGIYQLTESIKIATNRVNVTNDGYLLTLDTTLPVPNTSDFQTSGGSSGFWVTIKEPSEGKTGARKITIEDYVNEMETYLYGLTGCRDHLDTISSVDWYLINELAKNANTGLWLNYDPAAAAKLKLGPIWNYGDSFQQPSSGFAWKGTAWFGDNSSDQGLFSCWEFPFLVKNRFPYFNSKQAEILANIDAKAASVRRSIVQNSKRWHGTPSGNDLGDTSEAILTAYDAEVQNLKDWITARFTWLEGAIN
ncbi:hypothetical protein AGMMS49982_19520 [Bacteroidia bacterium]|nr:hypothetical protein AGMMS49982_19520 [Bacteroidia bacterium]